jgi:hypothetical protein
VRISRDHETIDHMAMRGRPWTAGDRTGGPLDGVLDQLRAKIPGLVVERLEMPHPADDDNVFFIGNDTVLDQVQIDCTDGGQPPFVVEGTITIDGDRQIRTSDPDATAARVIALMSASTPTETPT